MPGRHAVFLDRDDTLIANRSLGETPGVRPGDLCDPSRVALLPGAEEGCRLLHAAGLTLVVVTNQGVVARGGGTLDEVRRTNDRVRELLPDHGRPGASIIDAVYACPFHPQGSVPRFTGEHPWRKPSGGMMLAAAEELGIDLRSSWMIGDAERDIAAAVDAGIPRDNTILLGPRVPDLLAAALVVLAGRAARTERSTVTLKAERPGAFEDPRVRDTVIATANAIAERTGLKLVEVALDASGVSATLEAPEVVAVGFGAELRRLTNAWHRAKFGSALWPEPGGGAGES